MSLLDPKTEAALKSTRVLLSVAKYISLVAFLFYVAGLLYFWLGLGILALGVERNQEFLIGFVFLAPVIEISLVLRQISVTQAAADRGDVAAVRRLISTEWIVASAVVGFGVPGVILLVLRGYSRNMVPAKPLVSEAVLEILHLKKYFGVRGSFFDSLRGKGKGQVHAVDDVTFDIMRGEVFGLAGESGSGKTTVLRTALMLTEPTAGSVIFKGKTISSMSKEELRKLRPKIQVVFQDPYESVNPRMTVFDIVAEGLFVNKLVASRDEAMEKVLKTLREVQITPAEDYLFRFPHELSGGQRQRIAIARALVLDPEIILADEPVSMLDVSIRAEVVNVLLSIREKRGIAVIMVTHDLALSKDMVDELAIMYLGKIVEMGPAEQVVAKPYHPYTHALTAAVPVPDPTAPKIRVLAKGEIPTNIAPPPGCRFHPRCPFAKAICAEVEPPLQEATQGRKVACHFWKEANEAFEKGLDVPAGIVVEA